MTRPALSVVIPTRDRAARLAETLKALAETQGVDGGFEVIVVDDGSTDETADVLEEHRGLDLRWWHQESRGPATARNRGLAEARASRVLLLGDDTRPTPETLAEHLRTAAAHGGEVAVQGFIDWDPEAQVTPLMRFLAPAGPQFYFKHLVAGRPVPWSAVSSSNFSAPTAWFRDEPFDESFPGAAFEDTELAYRWSRRDRTILYAPDAVCWHHHHYDRIAPFLERQRRAGRAAAMALKRHPRMIPRVAVEPWLFGFVVLGRHLLRSVRGKKRQEDVWDLQCRLAFFRGLLGF